MPWASHAHVKDEDGKTISRLQHRRMRVDLLNKRQQIEFPNAHSMGIRSRPSSDANGVIARTIARSCPQSFRKWNTSRGGGIQINSTGSMPLSSCCVVNCSGFVTRPVAPEKNVPTASAKIAACLYDIFYNVQGFVEKFFGKKTFSCNC